MMDLLWIKFLYAEIPKIYVMKQINRLLEKYIEDQLKATIMLAVDPLLGVILVTKGHSKEIIKMLRLFKRMMK